MTRETRDEKISSGRESVECKCLASTGICGSITRGTGKLDCNGYWEVPCPHGNAFSEYHEQSLSNEPLEKPVGETREEAKERPMPINWQAFKKERDRLPEYERENFTADVIDQMDDAHFCKVLKRNRAIYAQQYPDGAYDLAAQQSGTVTISARIADRIGISAKAINAGDIVSSGPVGLVSEPENYHGAYLLSVKLTTESD